jgi:hypothetical protein
MSEAAGDTLTTEESDNAQYLMGLVTSPYEGSQEEEQDAKGMCSEEAVLLDLLEESSVQQRVADDPIHAHADEFITYFSRLNIVRNSSLGHMGQERFLREFAAYVPAGNSRDGPTRFLFFYPNRGRGYKYSSPDKVGLRHHVVACNPSEDTSPAPLPSARYKCRKEGCTVEPFSTTHKRDYHEKSHA